MTKKSRQKIKYLENEIVIIIIFFFKVDFYITFYNCKKPINVNLLRKLEKKSDTKQFANSLM